MYNPEGIDNLSGYEQTDQINPSGYFLHKYIDLVEKGGGKTESRSMFEFIYGGYFIEEEPFYWAFLLHCKNVLIFHKYSIRN